MYMAIIIYPLLSLLKYDVIRQELIVACLRFNPAVWQWALADIGYPYGFCEAETVDRPIQKIKIGLFNFFFK